LFYYSIKSGWLKILATPASPIAGIGSDLPKLDAACRPAICAADVKLRVNMGFFKLRRAGGENGCV
jgi:hypothetical protein